MSKHLDVGKKAWCWRPWSAAFISAGRSWSLGWAQPVIDFVFWMHFIKPIYVIEPFEVARAGMLVAMTAGMGFLMGSIFALVWNALHKA